MSLHEHSKTTLGLGLRGIAMGIAEAIPGVSGGTIALITGIYGTLIQTIKSATEILNNPGIIFYPDRFWKQINGAFLLPLLIGMAGGVILGIFGVTYLMEAYPEPLWAFFFGITLASVLYLLIKDRPWAAIHYGFIALGALIAFCIVRLTPAEGSDHLMYIFLAGTIAISAFILPGISGSFMLLLMGLYSIVIPAVRDVLSFDFSPILIVAIFALGCLAGITFFSRFLNFLLNTYESATLAVLIGFMAGSLYKLWPWRNPIRLLNKEDNSIVEATIHSFPLIDVSNFRILSEHNVLPINYWDDSHLTISIISFAFGIITIYLFSRIEKNT